MKGVKTLTVDAVIGNLDAVMAFVGDALAAAGFPQKPAGQLLVATEEIFANIAHYAYPGVQPPGAVRLELEVTGEPLCARLLFQDSGTPFNPLARPDPDTHLPPEQRQAGGLGILMAKRMTDGMDYRREAGHNLLTLTKAAE